MNKEIEKLLENLGFKVSLKRMNDIEILRKEMKVYLRDRDRNPLSLCYDNLEMKVEQWNFWYDDTSDFETLICVGEASRSESREYLIREMILDNEEWREEEEAYENGDSEEYINHANDWKELAEEEARYAIAQIRKKLSEIEKRQPQLTLNLEF